VSRSCVVAYCHARRACPPPVRLRSSTGVNLSLEGRGDSVQTHRFLVRLRQYRQPNMCCLHWLKLARASLSWF
jgi:hypothetical protein